MSDTGRIGHEETPAIVNGVSDLNGKRVAVIPGTTTEQALPEAVVKAMVAPQIVKVPLTAP